MVGCLSQSLRTKLLEVLGLEDTRSDPNHMGDGQEDHSLGHQLTENTEKLFQGRTTDEWLKVLAEVGIPASPMRFTEQLLDDTQVIANDLVVELEHNLVGKVTMAGPLAKMSGTPVAARSASPSLGQHTDQILSDLGYSTDIIQELRALGVTR